MQRSREEWLFEVCDKRKLFSRELYPANLRKWDNTKRYDYVEERVEMKIDG